MVGGKRSIVRDIAGCIIEYVATNTEKNSLPVRKAKNTS